MIKNLYGIGLILISPFVIIGCKPNKEIATTQTVEVVVEDEAEIIKKEAVFSATPVGVMINEKNLFMAICECQNSKATTIEDYGKMESKKENLSVTVYAETIPNIMGSDDNWLMTEFFQDEMFLDNLELISAQFKKAQTDEATFEKMKAITKAKYPICYEVIPSLIILAKRN
jgi:uncharacterized protein YqfB (UPF0267 family)